ncbi:MAG: hypothetical protein KF887_10540 [Paracoccaceae bacterium]|nr:MAG: hypothetical protein KF887_10540 [Paracoccaceae bacterium]
MPTGDIVAHSARDTLMGHRGILHDGAPKLGFATWWHPQRFSACVLKRSPDAHGSHTALFFLDEAVAMPAGHRPCAARRRDGRR